MQHATNVHRTFRLAGCCEKRDVRCASEMIVRLDVVRGGWMVGPVMVFWLAGLVVACAPLRCVPQIHVSRRVSKSTTDAASAD
jgi:hypothetical protein